MHRGDAIGRQGGAGVTQPPAREHLDKGPSLGASGSSWACGPLDPALLASRAGGESISVV